MAITLLGNYDEFFTDQALPRMVAIVQDQVNPANLKSYYDRLFKNRPVTADIIQYGNLVSLGTAVKTGENQNYQLAQFSQGYKKTFTPVKYTLGYGISEEMREDMPGTKMNEAFEMSAHLGRSMTETREIIAANVFNTAFSLNQPYDGVPLCSAAHPPQSPYGIPQANTPVDANGNAVHLDLSHTAIRYIMTQMLLQKDEAGKLTPCRAEMLVVPAALAWDGFEITRSPDRSDTANRATNIIASNPEMPLSTVVQYPYLTSTTRWFIMGNNHMLIYANKRDIMTDVFDDPNNKAVVVTASMRFDVGPAAWRDFYGVS